MAEDVEGQPSGEIKLPVDKEIAGDKYFQLRDFDNGVFMATGLPETGRLAGTVSGRSLAQSLSVIKSRGLIVETVLPYGEELNGYHRSVIILCREENK